MKLTYLVIYWKTMTMTHLQRLVISNSSLIITLHLASNLHIYDLESKNHWGVQLPSTVWEKDPTLTSNISSKPAFIEEGTGYNSRLLLHNVLCTVGFIRKLKCKSRYIKGHGWNWVVAEGLYLKTNSPISKYSHHLLTSSFWLSSNRSDDPDIKYKENEN